MLGAALALTTSTVCAQTPTVRYAFSGNATDLSGNGRTGTPLGGATYAGGSQLVIGDNAVDQLQIPAAAANGLTDFTVTATVRFNTIHNASAAGLNPILSGANNTVPATTDNALLLTLGAGVSAWRMQINSIDYRFGYGAITPVAGTCYHVTFVRQGAVGRCYINGVAMINTVSGTTNAAVSTATITVDPGGLLVGQEQDFTGAFAPNIVGGGFQANQSLAGSLGELTIYNGALSAAQIQALARQTWTGEVSTTWTDANNWSYLRAPLATDNSVIPAAPTNQPTLSAAGTAADLTIDAGATLTQTAAGSLDLKGNLVSNSTSTTFGGATGFTGTVGKSISGTGTTAFANLGVGPNGLLDATPSGLSVSQVLGLQGNLTVGATPLLLRSTAAGTAHVVNAGGVVSGTARVEVYLNPTANATRGYRHMSSPVVSTPLNDMNVGPFSVFVNTTYNTSPKGLTLANFPNTFFYDESKVVGNDFDLGWQSPNSASDPMIVGRGYSVSMPALTPDFVGTLNTGNVGPLPLTNTFGGSNAGWNLIGNPYPAPVDWNKVRAIPGAIPATVTDGISVFKSTGLNAGTYLTYNNGLGTLPGGLIGVGQAFFIRVPAINSAAFTFTDAMRATPYATTTHWRAAPDARPALTLTLRNVAADLADQTMLYFEDGATAGFDPHFDAYKVGRSLGDAPTLGLPVAGEELALNGLPAAALTQAPVLPLRVRVNVAGEHEIAAADLRNLPAGLPLWLIDAEAGTVTDLTAVPAYRFQLDPAFDGARFQLQIGGAQPVATRALSAPLLTLYPNPVSAGRTLTLTLAGLDATAAAATVTLTDALGRIVRTLPLTATAGTVAAEVPVAGLPKGIYTLRAASSGQTQTRLVVIE